MWDSSIHHFLKQFLLTCKHHPTCRSVHLRPACPSIRALESAILLAAIPSVYERNPMRISTVRIFYIRLLLQGIIRTLTVNIGHCIRHIGTVYLCRAALERETLSDGSGKYIL